MKKALIVVTRKVTSKEAEKTRIAMGYRCSNRHCGTQYRRPEPDEDLKTERLMDKVA